MFLSGNVPLLFIQANCVEYRKESFVLLQKKHNLTPSKPLFKRLIGLFIFWMILWIFNPLCPWFKPRVSFYESISLAINLVTFNCYYSGTVYICKDKSCSVCNYLQREVRTLQRTAESYKRTQHEIRKTDLVDWIPSQTQICLSRSHDLIQVVRLICSDLLSFALCRPRCIVHNQQTVSIVTRLTPDICKVFPLFYHYGYCC